MKRCKSAEIWFFSFNWHAKVLQMMDDHLLELGNYCPLFVFSALLQSCPRLPWMCFIFYAPSKLLTLALRYGILCAASAFRSYKCSQWNHIGGFHRLLTLSGLPEVFRLLAGVGELYFPSISDNNLGKVGFSNQHLNTRLLFFC